MIFEKNWKREMERGAQLPAAAAIRCRVRYFTDGGIIGSQEFVQRMLDDTFTEPLPHPPAEDELESAGVLTFATVRRPTWCVIETL